MNTHESDMQIKEILSLINLKKFKEADLKLSIFAKNHSSIDVIENIKGLISLKKEDYKISINFFKKAIEINSQYLNAYINLASAYGNLKSFDESIKCLEKALIINPNLDTIHNNLSYVFSKINKTEKSIYHSKKAKDLNPDNPNNYFNLGNIFFQIQKYENAIEEYRNTIEINKNFNEVFFQLAESYKKIKNYEDALFNYKIAQQENTSWLRKEKIIAKILECYLILDKKDDYIKEINFLSMNNSNNRRIAATSSFIANQFKIKNDYPFCPQPLNFIFHTSLKKYFENFTEYLTALFTEITSEKFRWEPSGKTTRNGYGTVGNLYEKKLPFVSKLEDCINKELITYFELYKNENIKFIKNWPLKFKIISWSNRLKKEGYNISHIHPGGWVSGVFYLQIPNNVKNNEGGIEFSLHGDDYYIVHKDIPNKTINPDIGDLVLFPSSLFHRTIPFNSNEERVCIAFDLCGV